MNISTIRPGKRVAQRLSCRILTGGLVPAAVALLTLMLSAPPVSAQPYSILGSIEARSVNAYRKDSPVVPEDELRGSWYATSLLRAELTHRWTLTRADVVIDHALTAVPAAVGETTPTVTAGTAGTGSLTATTALVGHELFQAYAAVHPAPWLSLRVGRQRINWGVSRVFPVSDALHPQSPDAEIEPGFDGAALSLRSGGNATVELAAAIQDAATTGDIEDVRAGAYGTLWVEPAELFVSWVWQRATMLRLGSGFSVPVGPLLVAAEGAVEIYDPRARLIEIQPLLTVRAEYTWFGDAVDLVISGEYFHNGLAATYPADPTGDRTVTTDLGGGFARPGSAYAAGGLALAVVESWSTDHTVVVNLEDDSAVVRHGITASHFDSLDLTAAASWNTGRFDSEFGRIAEGLIVELGARLHF